jgi:23S rRNA (cytidine1920-2'-O)/16S rRNA (cytidine1409-2'-O)-methyltransferase
VSGHKERLDELLVGRGLAPTQSQAQALIMAGEVFVDGVRVDKAGTRVSRDAELEVSRPLPYVSRGGYKLAKALDVFALSVRQRVCADVGACTGGFTDVLLQEGAARVYAIDVGYGLLDWKLRQDERVVVMERTNARTLQSLPEAVTFVAVDVSFISLKLILPSARRWLAAEGDVVALVKPQFEAAREQVGEGGVIRDPGVHAQVLRDVLQWAYDHKFGPLGLIRSPVQGASGNVEFLLWMRPGEAGTLEVERAIDRVL